MKKTLSIFVLAFSCILIVYAQTGNTNTVTEKILIAYFTWADNTVVTNQNSINVDAATSASVLVPGNTALIAERIKQITSGDLFQITVTEPYSSDYNECIARATREKTANERPRLKNRVGNMSDYDIVFLGYPTWLYTCPMTVLTFLESYDFSGKTVVLFNAHGTGGLANSVQDITAKLPRSVTILKPLGVPRGGMRSLDATVGKWIAELGIE
jgi:flavodoxin